MKFKDCFIDEHGNVWRTKTLIEASEKLPTTSIDINDISLDEILRWKLVNLRDYCNHFNRATNANLKVHVILRNDGYIMDGWHRVIKALSLGIEHLPAKQFEVNPEPDFKM